MKKALALASLLVVAGAAFAQTKTFNVVGDRLQFRNVATVESVTEFETFTGRTSVVSGSLKFDPSKKIGSGSLKVDVASIDTGIPTRNDHMKSGQWLDAEKYADISFETTSVRHAGGDNYRVTGKFTMKGVTKTITTTARVRFRAASPEVKAVGFEGDVLHLNTSFEIKLSDYGVKIPPIAAGKVSDTVKISLSAYAVAK